VVSSELKTKTLFSGKDSGIGTEEELVTFLGRGPIGTKVPSCFKTIPYSEKYFAPFPAL
jgi:hypothetical protein